MNFEEYQKESRKTAIYPEAGNNWIYPLLGLAGEAGEISDKMKKVIRDDNNVISEEKREEVIAFVMQLIYGLAQRYS